MAQNNVSNTDWTALRQAEDMAYFRAEACLLSPESYSLEEKRAICDGIDESNEQIGAALKADFESLPPVAQVKMLDLLKQADPANFEWWREILVGKTPSCVSDVS